MDNMQNLLQTIKNDATQRSTKEGIPQANLYIEETVLNKGYVITSGQQNIQIAKPSIMVFADDDPLKNWAHPCRFFIYDAESGSFIEEISARFPPHMTSIPGSYTPFFEPIKHTSVIEDIQPASPVRSNLFSAYAGERYAVLFSGASDYRHVNDLQYLYNILTGVYNFSPDNIYVLNYDGKDIPLPANRQNIV